MAMIPSNTTTVYSFAEEGDWYFHPWSNCWARWVRGTSRTSEGKSEDEFLILKPKDGYVLFESRRGKPMAKKVTSRASLGVLVAACLASLIVGFVFGALLMKCEPEREHQTFSEALGHYNSADQLPPGEYLLDPMIEKVKMKSLLD